MKYTETDINLLDEDKIFNMFNSPSGRIQLFTYAQLIEVNYIQIYQFQFLRGSIKRRVYEILSGYSEEELKKLESRYVVYHFTETNIIIFLPSSVHLVVQQAREQVVVAQVRFIIDEGTEMLDYLAALKKVTELDERKVITLVLKDEDDRKDKKQESA